MWYCVMNCLRKLVIDRKLVNNRLVENGEVKIVVLLIDIKNRMIKSFND